MQQPAQQPQTNLPVGGNRLPQPSSRGAFVVNLGSSSTPVALSSPQHPELKKFTFFVSRRREDGRERFRLHMGYFETQQDAEEILAVVRDIYPGAWTGVAQGRKAPEQAPLPAAPAAQAPSAPVAQVPSAQATMAVSPAIDVPLELEPPPPPPDEHFAAVQSLSSVRAAIASLDDGTLPKIAKLPDTTSLSPAETLQLLEPAGVAAQTPAQPPLAPEAVAAYAVQLRWSAQPIAVAELPPLAIFDAYTLYRANGRQDGGRWHALRLGFFNDQVSANQVLSYILPEFADATIVPVGGAERDRALAATAARATMPAARANGANAAAGTNATQSTGKKHGSGVTGQFKLIDDPTPPDTEPSRLEMMLTTDVVAQPAPAASAAAAKPAAKDPGKHASKDKEKIKEKLRARRPPSSLEETLDLLGAGNLKLDTNRGEMLDASGVRRMRHAADRKPPARSALSRLFDRLADSVGGGR